LKIPVCKAKNEKKSTEKWAIIESENACEPLAGILIFPTLTICVVVWAS